MVCFSEQRAQNIVDGKGDCIALGDGGSPNYVSGCRSRGSGIPKQLQIRILYSVFEDCIGLLEARYYDWIL
jgi:hypothetical protein